MPQVIHSELLDDFRVVNGDQQATAVDTPRHQSLLAYLLLLHRDAPQPRRGLPLYFGETRLKPALRADCVTYSIN